MVDELRRKQHCMLRVLMMEEAKKIQGASQEWSVEGLTTMKKVSEEIEELEHQMKESAERGVYKIKALQAKIEEEILQTRTVPLEEVRGELDCWVPAFQKEYENLTAGPVVPIMEEEFQRLKASGQRMEILPMKAVATRKPPNKRKGRVVVCGNSQLRQELKTYRWVVCVQQPFEQQCI